MADFKISEVGDELTVVDGTELLEVEVPGAPAASHHVPWSVLRGDARLTPVGSSLGTSGTVDLDMAALTGSIQTIAVSGDITFTTSNRAAGRTVTLVLTEGGTASRSLTFPSWVFVGAAAPAAIDDQKVVVTVTFMGAADTDGVAAAAVSV